MPFTTRLNEHVCSLHKPFVHDQSVGQSVSQYVCIYVCMYVCVCVCHSEGTLFSKQRALSLRNHQQRAHHSH